MSTQFEVVVFLTEIRTRAGASHLFKSSICFTTGIAIERIAMHNTDSVTVTETYQEVEHSNCAVEITAFRLAGESLFLHPSLKLIARLPAYKPC